MENISGLNSRSYIEVDTSVVQKNVKNIQEFIGENTKLMSILKADAYGLGIEKISQLIEPLTDWFGVATIEEALQIKKQDIKKPILVMGYVSDEYIQQVVDLNITLCTISVDYVKHLNTLIPNGQTLDVHLKIDTGMNRVGLYSPDYNIENYIQQIEDIIKLDKINITGIYTHLVSAGSTAPNEIEFTQHQYDTFIAVCDAAENKGYDIGIRHLSNSYGTIYNRDMYIDMVRVGIFIGFGHYLDIDDLDLNLAFRIRARIVNVKTIGVGESIGYDRTFTTTRPTKIATVSFGYADGFRSNQSNKSEVIINGQRAKMVGRIAMDYLMVDVTDLQDVKVGDYATLIGKDGNDVITPYENSQIITSTIPEPITQIGARVFKVYI